MSRNPVSYLARRSVRGRRRRAMTTLAVAVVGAIAAIVLLGTASAAQRYNDDVVDRELGGRVIELSLEQSGAESRTVTPGGLAAIRTLPGVTRVEGVFHAGFGIKTDDVPGVLLRATPQLTLDPPPLEMSTRPQVFPLADGEVVVPRRAQGMDLESLLGQKVDAELQQGVADGLGVGASRPVRIVGLFDESWQFDGRDVAYVSENTALEWAGLRAGSDALDVLGESGYERALVGLTARSDTPLVLHLLQEQGYVASSYSQRATETPALISMLARFGWIAVLGVALMIGLGLFAVSTVAVSHRTSEFGVLRSIGMGAAQIRRLVLGEHVAVATVGAGIGVAIGAALTGPIGSRLLQSGGAAGSSIHPGVSLIHLVAVLAVTCVAAGVGSLLPARRAAALDPIQAINTV